MSPVNQFGQPFRPKPSTINIKCTDKFVITNEISLKKIDPRLVNLKLTIINQILEALVS